MIRRIIIAALALILSLGLCGSSLADVQVIASGSCGSNAEWKLYSSGALMVSGSGSMTDFSSGYSTPWYNYNSFITYLIIEEGITSIGSNAFYKCSSLDTALLPESLDSIGEGAFFQCKKLAGVSISEGLTHIGRHAFDTCTTLSTITLPETLVSIGEFAFFDCKQLPQITIHENVNNIDDLAFYGCSMLKEISFTGRKLPTISESAFNACSPAVVCHKYSAAEAWAVSKGYPVIYHAITTVASGTCGTDLSWKLDSAGTLTISGTGTIEEYYEDSWYTYRNSIYDLVIEEGINALGYGAFFAYRNIKSVSLPNSLTSIGEEGFRACRSLTSISIPNSVSEIGALAFYDCSALTSIRLPSSLTSISHDTFSGCSSLAEVVIPSRVTSIGMFAFYGCSSLRQVTIPDSVIRIDSVAFYDCKPSIACCKGSFAEQFAIKYNYTVIYLPSTKALWLPASLKTIREEAFLAANITEAVIPVSVTSIESRAFADCQNLTRVVFEGNTLTIANDAFDGCRNVTFVCSGNSSAAAYAQAHQINCITE